MISSILHKETWLKESKEKLRLIRSFVQTIINKKTLRCR